MRAALVWAILIASAITYLIWLDSGCVLNGVMTVHGKVCVENL